MHFTILGPPRTKKNHGRLVRARGKLRLLPSAAHEQWARSAIKQLATAWFEPPLRGPVHVRALFYRDRNVGDLNNYIAAVGDALEHAGVIENDRQIVSWDGSRLCRDSKRPRIEIDIEEVAADGRDPEATDHGR